VKIQVGSFETFKQQPKYFCYVYIEHNILKKFGLGVESFGIQLPDSLEVIFSLVFVKNKFPWREIRVHLLFHFPIHLPHPNIFYMLSLNKSASFLTSKTFNSLPHFQKEILTKLNLMNSMEKNMESFCFRV
jgi:hypothetical protein